LKKKKRDKSAISVARGGVRTQVKVDHNKLYQGISEEAGEKGGADSEWRGVTGTAK